MNEASTSGDQLARDLRRLSAPAERPDGLLERARHRAATQGPAAGGPAAIFVSAFPTRTARMLAGTAAIIIGALGLGMAINVLSPAAFDQAVVSMPNSSVSAGVDRSLFDPSVQPAPFMADRDSDGAAVATDGLSRGRFDLADSGTSGRHIVRKASIEIQTGDVAAAFRRVQLLVNEGQGEFVAESSQQGLGRSERASVTLRVAPSRLGAVLGAVRDMGVVVAETRGGDDVTDRVVDLEARLRNEKRIEEELLELLGSRTDAPLDDILQLRRQLSEVRGAIERLEGQRSTIRQLVSLATVLVLIRVDQDAIETEPPADQTSMLDRFGTELGGAWRAGLTALMGSVATLMRVLLGGLLWWAILIVLVTVLYRRFSRV